MRIALYAVSSPYAAEALESAQRLGWEVAVCVRNLPGTPVPDELPGVVEADTLSKEEFALPFVVALVGPAHRYRAIADAFARGFSELASLIDPTAVVAGSARLAAGAYVNAGAIIAAGVRAGIACQVNRGASIGHHSELGDYVTLGPGAVTGGNCRLGTGAFLGVGSVIAPEISVAPNAVVGAGAVVVNDVPEKAVVVGNPARVLRVDEGYGGLGVPADAHLRRPGDGAGSLSRL